MHLCIRSMVRIVNNKKALTINFKFIYFFFSFSPPLLSSSSFSPLPLPPAPIRAFLISFYPRHFLPFWPSFLRFHQFFFSRSVRRMHCSSVNKTNNKKWQVTEPFFSDFNRKKNCAIILSLFEDHPTKV